MTTQMMLNPNEGIAIFEKSNWNRVKDGLKEGLDDTKSAVLDVTLENTRKMLVESASVGTTNAGSIAALNKVMLPVIRRVMPTVIANELVGVQPMTGPVGQIHTLRVRYAEGSNPNADQINQGAATVVGGEEALSPFKIAQQYSGDGANPGGAPTSYLEGRGGKQINVQVMKEIVHARSHKLSARWTFEAQQDAQAQHGLDIEAEILAALAQEITTEIDQYILGQLRQLSMKSVIDWDFDKVQGSPNYTPTFIGDVHAPLAIAINERANKIAARTRRGPGNWCVVSPDVVTALQSATTSAFARTTEGEFEAPTNVKQIGVLNGVMKVYVNTYAPDDRIIIGYKGPTETDAAGFYCPWIPLMSSGVVIDPNTFEPTVSFMTRYGWKVLTQQAGSLGNAGDYMGQVNVNNLRFVQS